MQINLNNPLVLESTDVIRIGMILDKPVKDILTALSKIQVTNPYKFSRLTNVTSYKDLKVSKDVIYIPRQYSRDESLFPIALILMSDIADITKFENINSIYVDVLRVKNNYSNIISKHENLKRYYNDFYADMKKFMPFKIFNKQEWILACKKNKVRALENGIGIEIPNVKVGNEIEGYINYKKVVVKLKMNLNPDLVEFHFSSFHLSSKDIELLGDYALHPHIRDTFCFGNRNDDYHLYTMGHNYSFLIDLLVESVKSYNPEGPYISISQIAYNIGVIKKKLNELKEAGIDFNSDRATVLRSMWNNLPKCKCGALLDGKNCTANRCKRNPNAIIGCDRCMSNLIFTGEYCEKMEQYIYKCSNTDCITNRQHYETTAKCNNCGHSDMMYVYRDEIYCQCNKKDVVAIKLSEEEDYIFTKQLICPIIGCDKKLNFGITDLGYRYACSSHGNIYRPDFQLTSIIKRKIEIHQLTLKKEDSYET